MKKKFAFILAVMTAVGAYSVVKGGSETTAPTKRPAVCFVVETDDLFGFDFDQLYDEVYGVVEQYGYIRAVCADGHPFIYVDVDISPPEKNYTKAKQKKINKQITDSVISMLKDIDPRSAEDDLLGAIKLGKQALGRCREATSRDMIAISSGISRAGVLCFQDYEYCVNGRIGNSLLTVRPEEVAAELTKNFSIPDLSTLDSMLWYGCGSSLGEQHVSDSAAVKIQALWDRITEEAGCPAEFIDISSGNEPFSSDLYSTVIDFGEDRIEIEPPNIDIKFEDSHLGFIPDQAVLRDENAAMELLKPYAQTIIEYSKNSDATEPILYVVGLTATVGDPKLCETLSLARAETVKKLLVSLGCPKALIGTLGLGQGGPDAMRADDTIETDDVETLESLRTQNRVVYLIGTASEKAKLLGLS